MVIDLKYQTFWRRFGAGFVDSIVAFPIGAVGLLAYREGLAVWSRVAWYLVANFGFVVYVVVMHARYGQTWGKMLTDVKVLDISEGKLSARQALIREAVPLFFLVLSIALGLPSVMAGADPTLLDPTRLEPTSPSSTPGIVFWFQSVAGTGWFAAELITMLTNKKRRAVHDFLARSVVIRVDKEALRESRGIV